MYLIKMNKKRSIVWDFFIIKVEDESTAICELCNVAISRGKLSDRRYSTTPLYTHLRSQHGPVLARAEKEQQETADQQTGNEQAKKVPVKRSAETAGMTLEQVLSKKQPWGPHHPAAETATKFLAEMIAVDLQPYAIVENEGFRRYSNHLEPRYSLLSRRLLSEQIIPDIYTKVKDKLTASLSNAGKISFTTDTWTEPCTTRSFIGMSGHWIDADWQQKFAILSCEEFTGKHSGERIAAKFVSVLECWGINKPMIRTVMRDNATNMVKAFRDAEIPSVGCTLHTLQLAIHDCILDQRAVSDALAACRRLVGHFKHSSAASHRLTELQKELHCDVLRPVQDVSTRWNSTYYMIQRLLAIKRSLSVYCTETDPDKALTANTWVLMENVCHLLAPLEKLTRDFSAYDARLSAVIPGILGLKLTLQADKRDVGVKTMKSGLLGALDERFEPLLANTCATIATAVDPHFKLRFFPSDTVRDEVKQAVRDAALVASRQQREAAVKQEQPTVRSQHATATDHETETPSASTSSSNAQGTYFGFTSITKSTTTTTTQYYTTNLVYNSKHTLIL